MLLDWLLKTEEGNISYEELKMSNQDRSRWSEYVNLHCREGERSKISKILKKYHDIFDIFDISKIS